MTRHDLIARMAAAQAQRGSDSLLRRLRTASAVDATTIVLDGRRLLNFASNDYLGLAQHPELVAALTRAAQRSGVGASAAHLLGGHRDEHAALELALSEWTGRERAVLFSTGYMANLGLLQALLVRGDLCVQDKLNHASLLDGARLAGSELKRYLHADVDSARRQLATRADAPALLATDGVFSMDGDVAPLRELATVCREQQATLMVDDAHGLGVLGAHGAGSVVEAGLGAADVPILMATLGKALGVAGAFVAGPAALIDGLVQFARSHVYSTAMPPRWLRPRWPPYESRATKGNGANTCCSDRAVSAAPNGAASPCTRRAHRSSRSRSAPAQARCMLPRCLNTPGSSYRRSGRRRSPKAARVCA